MYKFDTAFFEKEKIYSQTVYSFILSLFNQFFFTGCWHWHRYYLTMTNIFTILKIFLNFKAYVSGTGKSGKISYLYPPILQIFIVKPSLKFYILKYVELYVYVFVFYESKPLQGVNNLMSGRRLGIQWRKWFGQHVLLWMAWLYSLSTSTAESQAHLLHYCIYCILSRNKKYFAVYLPISGHSSDSSVQKKSSLT